LEEDVAEEREVVEAVKEDVGDVVAEGDVVEEVDDLEEERIKMMAPLLGFQLPNWVVSSRQD
jgi:hypothetical protein